MELNISHGLILFGGQAPPSPPPPPPERQWGAPSGKVCVVSVASFLVVVGGGGQDPKCTDKNVNILRERVRNIYFQDSRYICLYIIQPMHFPLLMVWRYKRYYTDKTLKLRRKKSYEYASERA